MRAVTRGGVKIPRTVTDLPRLTTEFLRTERLVWHSFDGQPDTKGPTHKPAIGCARPVPPKRAKPMGRCRKRAQPMAQKRALRHSYPPRAQQSGSGNVSPTRVMSGAPGAIRTRDTRFRRAVLYPLSYGGGYVAGRAGTRASASELLFYATCSTSSRRARAPPHRGGWQAARGASWDSD